MKPELIRFRSMLFAVILLLLVSASLVAQFNLTELRRELDRRNLYSAIQNSRGELFAGTWGAGIWKSTDEGSSWFRASEGLLSYDIRKIVVDKNDNLYAATSEGLFKSSDRGNNWIKVNVSAEKLEARTIIIADDNYLLISDAGEVYQSKNSGTWVKTGSVPAKVVIAPAVVTNSGSLIVGSESGLYSSPDFGKTWNAISNYISEESIIDIFNLNGSLFITTLNKGLVISKDDGLTVTSMNDGLSAKRIKFVTSDGNDVFASTLDNGIYILDKDRDVWKKLDINLNSSVVEFISLKRGGKVIAGTSSGSVFSTRNSGLSWSVEPGKLVCARPNDRFINIMANEDGQKSFTPPPLEFYKQKMRKTNAATINVTYTGFSPEAQAAFQYAVDIWSSLITSSVPIKVNATYTSLGMGVLGSAGPGTAYTGFNNQPYANTWYAVALAEKLNGDRLNLNTSADIVANFNSDFSNWYFGTDGNTPFTKYDFVSVVLHELCHGLGYIGSFSYSGGQGSWGDGSYHYPYIFDRFLYNGSSQLLMNTGAFPNPSIDLGNQLTGNDLWWTGPNTGTVRMYAPGAWSGGSSVYHLDEATYPPGSGNNLMTYALSNGEAIHTPGPIVLNQMADMGWVTGAPVTYSIGGSIKDGSNVAISGVTVSLSGSSSASTTTNVSGAFTFSNLTAGGTYTVTPTKTNYSFSPASRVYSNLSGNQAAANFTGTTQPAASVSPSSLAYGDVKTSQTSDKTVTITNTGLATLTVSNLSFSGVDTASFRLVSPPAVPFTLGPAANQVVTVRFAPASVGAKTATFTVFHNATGGTTNVSLTGNGTASTSAWSQNKTAINFDSLGYLSSASDSLLLVSNTSSGDTLSIISVVYTGGNNKFSLNETLPVKIAPNGSRNIKIKFNPDSTGTFAGTITFNNNSSNMPAAALNVSGKVFGSTMASNKNNINFGIAGLNSGNRDSTIEITNTGAYKLKIYSVSLSASDASFEVVTTVPPEGFTVNPGGKQSITVRLKPESLGTKTGTVTIRSNSSNNPNLTVTLNAVVQQSYLTFTPSNVLFDSTTVIDPFKTINIIIRNTTSLAKNEGDKKVNTNVTVINKVITGDTESFKILDNKINFVLAGGSSDTIKVQFAPRSSGIKNAVLTITTNDLTPIRTINLTGLGAGKPVLTAAFASISYGDFSAGKIKDTALIIGNTGNLDLNITSKSFAGTDNASFSFLSSAGGKTLGRNEYDTIRFRFTAGLPAGPKSAQLAIASNDPAYPNYNVTLSANVKFATITKDVTIIQYNATDVGGKSDTTVRIQNTGNSNLEISSVLIDGAFASDFLLGANYNSIVLAPGEERTIKVSFIPSDIGLRYARLVINSNDPAKPEDFIVLRGDGKQASLPSLSFTITKFEFGIVQLGNSKDTVVSLKNSGNADLIIDSLNIIGADKNLFAVLGKTVPFSIPAGATDNFTLRYQPLSGSANALLRIKSNDNQKPIVEVLLTGNSAFPSISISDSLLNFGKVTAGQFSEQTVKITNNGSTSLVIDSINLAPSSGIFSLVKPALPATILPGATLDLKVKFSPATGGNYSSSIVIRSNDPIRNSRIILMLGSGSAPKLILSQSINFGQVMSGNTKLSGFRIANAGDAALNVTGISFTGSHASEFEVVGKVFPYNVQEGQSDSVTVRWSPKSTGVKNAKAMVSTNDPASVSEITIIAEATINVSVGDSPSIPKAYALKQNYPNPFNPGTKILYAIKDAGFVTLKVYDVFGREVKQLISKYHTPGDYNIYFDATGLTSGIYYYTLNVNNFAQTKKMVLMK